MNASSLCRDRVARGVVSRRAAVGIVAASIAVTVAGCAGPSDLTQPPDIRFGRDVCSRCGMIISDATYAAAYRTEAGETRLFCDIGELPVYLREHSERPTVSFASSYETRKLARAETMFFVRSASLKTPMATGVAGFERQEDAQALASKVGGEVSRFEELLAQSSPMRGPSGRH